jgi:putative ABC transport system ATP-binding protein
MPVAAAAVTDPAADIVAMTDVAFAWPGRTTFAVRIARLSVARGERILLIGPSGSGKSTLLNLLCGVVAPQTGRIEILGTDIAGQPVAARDRFRAEHFGIIFQMFNLLPYATVLDNVVLPLHFAPARRQRATADRSAGDEARRLLGRLGLEPELIDGPAASALSVGQQQRVAAARALIGTPEIVVADEPTSSLDRARQQAFLDLLFAEVASAGATLIMVSHDETLSRHFDRVLPIERVVTSARGVAR